MRVQHSGRGAACGHAGEIFQGALRTDECVRRVLLSLPTPELQSTAHITMRKSGGLVVAPEWKRKSLEAARLAFAEFGIIAPDATVHMESNIAVCRGLGSSTADCVASARAVADLCGRTLSDTQLARIACTAEQASDSTMFADAPVLFAHCDGAVHETIEGHMPAYDVVVVDDARDGVCTDEFARPDYDADALDEFAALARQLRQAIQAGDDARIAHIATTSARINQRYHAKPHFEAALEAGVSTGALGVAVAHSGNICALLYRAGEPHAMVEAQTALHQNGLRVTHTLRSAALGPLTSPLASATIGL